MNFGQKVVKVRDIVCAAGGPYGLSDLKCKFDRIDSVWGIEFCENC